VTAGCREGISHDFRLWIRHGSASVVIRFFRARDGRSKINTAQFLSVWSDNLQRSLPRRNPTIPRSILSQNRGRLSQHFYEEFRVSGLLRRRWQVGEGTPFGVLYYLTLATSPKVDVYTILLMLSSRYLAGKVCSPMDKASRFSEHCSIPTSSWCSYPLAFSNSYRDRWYTPKCSY